MLKYEEKSVFLEDQNKESSVRCLSFSGCLGHCVGMTTVTIGTVDFRHLPVSDNFLSESYTKKSDDIRQISIGSDEIRCFSDGIRPGSYSRIVRPGCSMIQYFSMDVIRQKIDSAVFTPMPLRNDSTGWLVRTNWIEDNEEREIPISQYSVRSNIHLISIWRTCCLYRRILLE